MRRQLSLFAAVPMLVALACAPESDTAKSDSGMAAEAANDPAVVRQSIEAANAKFTDAMSKGDTATMFANYADDATMMMAGAPAWNGRAAIATGLSGMMSQYAVTNPKFTTWDVMVSGDVAVETGAYEMTMQEKGKKAINDKGKYLTVWKRQADGSWKIVRDIANTDLPPTG